MMAMPLCSEKAKNCILKKAIFMRHIIIPLTFHLVKSFPEFFSSFFTKFSSKWLKPHFLLTQIGFSLYNYINDRQKSRKNDEKI